MKILVCIKQVPASTKVEVDSKTGVLKRDGADAKMNPYDLFALETALKIKEQVGGEITALTMGPKQAEVILYEAFSMGVDNGVLLSDRAFAGSDVLATAYALSSGIKNTDQFDLILCGKQTTDGDTAQVGSALAEQLGVSSMSNVTEIEVSESKEIIVKMDMGDSIFTAKVQTPCVLSVDKDICQPRLPSYIKKKATKDREIKVLTFNDLKGADVNSCGLSGSPTKVARIFPPEKNDNRETWTGTSSQLAQKIASKIIAEKLI